MKNPFKAATMVHQPASELKHNNKKNKKGRGKGGNSHNNSGHSNNSGHNNNPEWSCSSCYVYAVQGREPGAAPLPTPADAAAGDLGEKLRKLAERLRETETPSPMP